MNPSTTPFLLGRPCSRHPQPLLSPTLSYRKYEVIKLNRQNEAVGILCFVGGESSPLQKGETPTCDTLEKLSMTWNLYFFIDGQHPQGNPRTWH